ncbi:MAG: exo-alpha-sialidase [Planctomycetes bacterium]|nr:exo-alpha-sialidase [Planctomycetota bacterium]
MKLLAALAIVLAPAAAPQDRSRPGPWDGDAVLYESSDGLNFKKSKRLVEGAGVPTLIADKRGRLVSLFQWFPKDDEKAFDKVAVSFSEDAGRTWSAPRAIVVNDFPESLMRPFDPTVVLLEDGRFRVYFTSNAGGKGPLRKDSPPGIYSAISEDAVTWIFEPGMRFGVEREFVIDCAAARLGREWHLYSPVQGKDGFGYHAVSTDGLKFERRKDVSLPVKGSWLGCAVTVGDKLRFYGSGLGGGWAAVSSDGQTWEVERDSFRGWGADPGVAQVSGGRWLMIGTAFDRKRERKKERPPERMSESESSVVLGDFVYVLRGGELLKIDPSTGRTVGRLPLDGAESGDRKAYWDFMRGLDSSRAPKHACRTFDAPRSVTIGRLAKVGRGGFPRPLWVGGRLFVFLSVQDRAWVVRLGDDLKPDGFEKQLKPEGARWVDHDLTSDGDFVYHYAMLPGGAGQVRKYDKDFNVVAETESFRASGTEMVLDQNIRVIGGKVYAGGEYREKGPWRGGGSGEQNIPPDAKQARGMHLRIFDLDLRPLGERDLTAQIEGAAVRNQFWGLGAAQLAADGYHCLVVHAPVGNVAKFPRGESVGARGIFVLRYDDQFRFVDSKGPLSDTDRDNFWCTGTWHDGKRAYIAYASATRGCVPGPGEEPSEKVETNMRLGIFDEDCAEIETIDLTRTGEGGMWPGMLKVGDRLYVTYVSETAGGAVVQEFVVR